MQWFLILVLILLAILSYLLFAPIFIDIDSDNNLYRLRFHQLASGTLVVKNYSFKIDLHLAWWKKQFDLFHKKSENKITKKTAPMKRARHRVISFKVVKALINSFKINTFRVDLDTDNMKLNGMLYPVFYGISRYTGKHIMINFLGNNKIEIQIENNLARMIRAYIYSSLKQKYHGKFR